MSAPAKAQIDVDSEFPEDERDRDTTASLTDEDTQKIGAAEDAISTLDELLTDVRQQLAMALRNTAKEVEKAVKEKDEEIKTLEARVSELESDLESAQE